MYAQPQISETTSATRRRKSLMGTPPVPRRSSNLAIVCGHGTTNKTTTAHQSKSLTAPATPHVEDPHQAGEDVPFIFISFRDLHGIHLQVLVEIPTELGKAMSQFCARTKRTTAFFLYDGERIMSDDTPQDLGIVDGDVIDVFEEQIGG
ncbi:hypothetical protein TI39_contig4211g00003 [Zymoseptoria brevis]|uniref:Ubiquitin-like domain-containing protein n=1 Tax=Zymoseptoria brevis TaxID=1047168 RepID=A0A0F4G9Y3_9PEZI|nr:hypothetical protein TI39_contig4211g00003 [Zymoseptoria brevis]